MNQNVIRAKLSEEFGEDTKYILRDKDKCKMKKKFPLYIHPLGSDVIHIRIGRIRRSEV